MIPGLATRLAPPFRLVVTHFIAGLLLLPLVWALLLVDPTPLTGGLFGNRLLAVVHVTALGFIAPIVIGALYQIVPVVLGVRLTSVTAGWAALALVLAGLAGMAAHFWMGRFSPGLAIASTLAATGLFLAASNLIASLRFVQSWSFGGVLIAVSLLFLLATAGLGLALALNLVFPYFSTDHISWLKVHAHLALVGWLGSVVMGATHKLIPMFTLGPEPPPRASAGAAALVFGGLFLLFATWRGIAPPAFGSIGAVALIAGAGTYAALLVRSFAKRARKEIDTGLRHVLAAGAALLAACLLALAAVFPDFLGPLWVVRLSLAYGFLLFGTVVVLIIGMLYKILPFLVWYHRYADRVGLEPVPTTRDIFSEGTARLLFPGHITGGLVVLFGILAGEPILLRAGALVLLVVNAGTAGLLIGTISRRDDADG